MIPLKVSGAFHSRLMEPAVDGLKKAIAAVTFKTPSVPIISNVTAGILDDPEEIKKELIDQITHCVQWQWSVENMVNNGVTAFYEIGHGQVLSGLIKRINPEVQVIPYLRSGQGDQLISPRSAMPVDFTREDKTAIVTLNRPEALNAFDPDSPGLQQGPGGFYERRQPVGRDCHRRWQRFLSRRRYRHPASPVSKANSEEHSNQHPTS